MRGSGLQNLNTLSLLGYSPLKQHIRASHLIQGQFNLIRYEHRIGKELKSDASRIRRTNITFYNEAPRSCICPAEYWEVLQIIGTSISNTRIIMCYTITS